MFFSLVESCRLQKVNVYEYLVFLLEKMPTMGNCIIEDYDSRHFDEYRKLLPDQYAKDHPSVVGNKWQAKYDKSKPIKAESKRKAYSKKKQRIA
ncbi:MAG: transposase domain-containing protein [Alistipes sp.]|nr:transposase domain-containing protein [Candidatus Alistipes equi]